MNRCVACGEPAPDGYDLCWFCRHAKHLPKNKSKKPDDDQPLCQIGAGEKSHSGLLEDYSP